MSQTRTLTWPEGPMTLEGAVSIEAEGQWRRPWRVLHDRLRLYEPALLGRAGDANGVRLSLVSDTSRLAVAVKRPDGDEEPADSVFDLLIDGQFHARQSLTADQARQPQTVSFANLPAGSHRLELYLPHGTAICVGAVEIDADATAERFDDDRPRWLVYGSSITQCRCAHGPSETWPALVANHCNLHLTSLGFGGQCHIDPMIGRTLAGLPADVISLCLGINTHASSFSERTFRAAVIGLIQLIRDRHPRLPVVCVSPIYSPPREETPGSTGMTLQLMRQWVADAVDALREHGDDQLAYADGLELFGPDYLHHMPDQLHPDPEGCHVLAQRYVEYVMPKLGIQADAPTQTAQGQ